MHELRRAGCTLHHLDVYRLDTSTRCSTSAWPSCSTTAAVTLIEWGDAIIPALPADYLEVRLTFGDRGDDERRWSIGPLVGPDPGPERGAAVVPTIAGRRSPVRMAAVRPTGEGGGC